MEQEHNYFVVSPLAVRQRLTRQFRKIIYPQMHLVYNYSTELYWIVCDDAPIKDVGPVALRDLLPLARYFGAYRPAERCKKYALQMPDGTVEPEGKLQHKLHIDFTTYALHDMLVKSGSKVAHKAADTTNIAAPMPEQDPAGLYTTDVNPVYGRVDPVGSIPSGVTHFAAAPGCVEVLHGKEPDIERPYPAERPQVPSASEVEYPEPPEGFDEPAPLTS